MKINITNNQHKDPVYNSPYCGDVSIQMESKEPGYILNLLPENGTLVEWGCGGSTVVFLDKLLPGQRLVTIEHNYEWYSKIKEFLKNHPNSSQHTFYYIQPTMNNPYYARPEEECPCGLEEYMCPDIDLITTADVFLVDGIGRGPTAAFLANKTKKNAHVIIHDYRGREPWYNWAVQIFDYNNQPTFLSSLIHMSNSKIEKIDEDKIISIY
jgi:hypothetical protein